MGTYAFSLPGLAFSEAGGLGPNVVFSGSQTLDPIFARIVGHSVGYILQLSPPMRIGGFHGQNGDVAKRFPRFVGDVACDCTVGQQTDNNIVHMLAGRDGQRFAALPEVVTTVTHVAFARNHNNVAARTDPIKDEAAVGVGALWA